MCLLRQTCEKDGLLGQGLLKMENRIILPEDVRTILRTLDQAGFEAYAVGGCIRDSLMGREPNDWDITTSATPLQVKALFRRTIDTGIQHGTVTVMLHRTGYEVTTYRIDGAYTDNRHPEHVTFTASLEEDLKRRDFTVNAMAYHEKKGLVDLFGGQADMQAGIIRCVGPAHQRFTEDALRMMRAVRFSAQFDYQIEADTFSAIRELAPALRKISAERIQTELVKLLTSPHPERLRLAYDTGITAVVLPEFDRCMETPQHNPHHCYTVGEHTLRSLQETEADKVLRLTMLFHDIGKPQTRTTDEQGIDHFRRHPEVSAEITRSILRRLKFDCDTMDRVCRLVRYHDWDIHAVPEHMRKYIAGIGEESFPAMFAVNRADILAQSDYHRQEKLDRVAQLEESYRRILAQGDCLSLKTLAVKGRDLMDAGMAPGKELGVVLQAMLEAVLEDPSRNTKEYLIGNLNEFRAEAQADAENK